MNTIHSLRLATLLFLLAGISTAQACDFCNCLAAINPWYNGSSSAALHVMIQRAVHGSSAPGSFIKSAALDGIEHGGHDHEGDSTALSTEMRTTFELSGRWQVSPEVMITAALPLVLIHADEVAAQGIGDPRIMAYYVVRDSLLSSALLLGGGVALPLGTVDLRGSDGSPLPANEQPGTQAFTAMADVTAQTRLGGWSLTANVLGRLPFPDGNRNRRGTSIVASGSVGHDLLRSNEQEMALIGTAGLRCESATHDRVADQEDAASGFTSLYAQLGGQLVLGSVRVEAATMIPLASRRPDGSPQEQARIVGGVRYQF